MKAVILAGGMGCRMSGLVRDVPKPMVALGRQAHHGIPDRPGEALRSR
ncbi:MAG TPA: hypothetical protein DCE19_02670 [Gemmatimonadetes bacterium]|nr:hypothetical protein [Gemmatimonadota bacterium]